MYFANFNLPKNLSSSRKNLLYKLVNKHRISKPLFVAYFTASIISLYFLYFAIFGAKGLLVFFDLKSQISNQEHEKNKLSAKIKSKQNMVSGMDTNSLDIDLLDEQVRKNLGYINQNEVIIYQNSQTDEQK